jgi:branched-chain amino acid transport system substrate-binding protein
MEKKHQDVPNKMSRRRFMKTVGTQAAVLGAALTVPRLVKPAWAVERDHILVGHPSSLTGPLAGLGEPTQWTVERFEKFINKDGGIYLKDAGKQLPVKIKIVDTESDPAKSADLSSQLILKDKIDLMMVMYTPDIVNPVTSVCERYEMPCISLGTPQEAWLTGGPYHWSFMAFWSVNTWTNLYLSMWDRFADKTNKVIGCLFPNDADGSAMAPIFRKLAEDNGYTFVDPGRFPYFNKDFSTIINEFKNKKVEILTASLISPDWTTVWRQCHQQNFVPKIATIGKALLFPSALESLGNNIGHGLTCETWWSNMHPYKSSLTGELPKDVCDTWENETKRQWTPSLGFKHAGFELPADTLKRAATLDKKVLREAIGATNLETIIGKIQWDKNQACETPLVLGQWVTGKKWPYEVQLVHNPGHPEIPVATEPIFPLPR